MSFGQSARDTNYVIMSKKALIVLVSLLMVSVCSVMAGSRDTLHTTYVVNTDFVPLHVVQVSAGGGLHCLLPKLTDEGIQAKGLRSGVGAGAQVQATYTYYFYKYVGVTGGLGFELYTGNMNGAFSDKVQMYYKDPAHATQQKEMYYWMNFDYQNFRESEQLYLLTIPVGVSGRVNVTDPLQLRGTVGLGMNIVAGSHYKGSGQLETTGDFPTLNLHLDPDLPQHGFSDYFMGGYQGKIQNTFPVSMFVFADLGVHYQFTRRYGIYGGIYFSYTCFNSVRPTTNEFGRRPELVEFDTKTKQFEYSGMINSKFVEALNPLAVGIKVGFTLTFLDPIKCNCEDW